jgi:hypothetical protein
MGTSASKCSTVLSLVIPQYDGTFQTSHTCFTNEAFAAHSSCNKIVVITSSQNLDALILGNRLIAAEFSISF